MNFTDQYIKMCNCEEVQEHRYGAAMQNKVLYCGDHYKDFRCALSYVYALEEDNATTGNFSYYITWLPLQYQIQQLIKSYVNCAYRLLQDFYYWCAVQRKEHIERVKGASMEELWLMFYMWREHYKIWENGEWVQLKEKRGQNGKSIISNRP